MKKLLAIAATVVAAYGMNAYAEEVKSGLEPGASPPAFNVQDVTGPNKGKSLCYRCSYGGRPVVSIFARDIDENLTKLIKDVDQQVGQNEDKQMRAFVVLLTDDPDAAEKKLAEVAQKNNIKNVPLTIFDGEAGPPDYKISEDADVTVLMWNKSKVKANHAFKGKLDAKSVESVAKDTSKILE